MIPEQSLAEPLHRGSCLCGGVQYELGSALRATAHCHCAHCRKAHGAAFATHASVPRTDLRVIAGQDLLRDYKSSATVTRSFCSQCGSQLFWHKRGEYEDWVAISLGTLDTAFVPSKQRHIFVGSKAAWFEILDQWPQSEKW